MEIRIGIQHSARELVLESDEPIEQTLSALSDAMSEGTAVTLRDAKGRTLLVPGPKVAYVEVSADEPRRVGFLG
ncbi:DUF3107 domain-containing protein [Brachybacterium phenoliresistens]|uniref:ATP-binding protein n=1 Tax=Brachybacterium phenoliresistens TaxID=396014 RepID=Z9JSF3_9MICO|nr:DUF3107 domain-containing protein [Brachybacterium phenoliresistens]EWS80687.1 ATP-binding protein [Brachybacterium phenoliresistens]